MFKKIALFVGGCLLAGSLVHAQVFEIETNPVEQTTQGVAPYDTSDISGHDFVAMEVAVKNISGSDLTLTWKNITDTTEAPDEWILTGICDNIMCRAEFGPWYYGTPQTTNPIPAGAIMEPKMAVHVYAPTNSPDGTGVFKIEISAHGQTDTAVFILTKQGVGVSSVAIDDHRVSIYPNPVNTGAQLHVFINKDLQASQAMIYNIIGRRVMALPVATTSEVNTYDVSRLPAGIYMLRLTNDQGKVITTRKFSKQ